MESGDPPEKDQVGAREPCRELGVVEGYIPEQVEPVGDGIGDWWNDRCGDGIDMGEGWRGCARSM